MGLKNEILSEDVIEVKHVSGEFRLNYYIQAIQQRIATAMQ
jgi:hypothetical protein